MNLFSHSNKKPTHLVLVKDRIRNIKRGYPWIFAHYLAELPQEPAGSLAVLKDKSGEILAKGFYDPESPLAFRILALGKENVDDTLIADRIEEAVSLRRALFDRQTTGYRLINGEGDGLPGLICDLYGDTAVIQFDGAGPKGFYKGSGIARIIAEKIQLKSVYRKPRHSEKGDGEVLFGELPSEDTRFLENGLTFSLDIIKGQKTGFFLDQRDNRHRVGRLARGKTLLNLFGYTGGFSIYAGVNSATHVTTVDLAKPAIEAAIKNWELNDLKPDRHLAIAQDAFTYLEESRAKSKTWGVVVVDPPSFAHSEDSVAAAANSYLNLLTAALFTVDQGGILAASSCSSHIDSAMFLDLCEKSVSSARRRATILGVYGQPEDHPYPMSCPELRYLKFVLLKVF